jgi:uncharacterized membrane protein YbhN (UPF0104 family)
VLVLGYNLGYLSNILPVPAGVGLLDGGLAAAVILYGASPVASLDAVLVYHAIAIWIPGLSGLAVWMWRGRKPRTPLHDGSRGSPSTVRKIPPQSSALRVGTGLDPKS